jgi:hypothetical protein
VADTEPLALLLCGRGVISSQLTRRFEALRYRVKAIANAADLVPCAARERAMVILADLDADAPATASALDQLKADTATAHIPVIAFTKEPGASLPSALMERGTAMVVSEAAILGHLPQLLQSALEIH